MRDFLPANVRRRDHVIGVIKRVYEKYGFEPLETPALENIETLTGKYGDEGNKLIFKVLRRGQHESSGESDLALRYDLTVPLARVIAQHRAVLPKFFKRYQIQPVWRADRPARGRFREFYQCDADAIGSRSMLIEVELLSAVSEVLDQLGLSDAQIHVNHRDILRALLTNAQVPDFLHATTLVSLDKWDKIGLEGVTKELSEKGLDRASQSRLFGWLGAAYRPNWLDWLEGEFVLLDEQGRKAFSDLREIYQLSAVTPAQSYLRFDPSLARGLSYYTGPIMEIRIPDLPGSLGAGGRYDGLIGMFLGEDIPACGFSLGLERILVVLEERGSFPDAVTHVPADLLISFMDESAKALALSLATLLRRHHLRVELYPEPDKPAKSIGYADKRGVLFLIVLGSNEVVGEVVTVRHMRTKKRFDVRRSELAERLLSARTQEIHDKDVGNDVRDVED